MALGPPIVIGLVVKFCGSLISEHDISQSDLKSISDLLFVYDLSANICKILGEHYLQLFFWRIDANLILKYLTYAMAREFLRHLYIKENGNANIISSTLSKISYYHNDIIS